jgi:hypothetical protein
MSGYWIAFLFDDGANYHLGIKEASKRDNTAGVPLPLPSHVMGIFAIFSAADV